MEKEFTAEVTIRYDRGWLTVWREEFLRASATWLRKWLKVAALDYNHEREILTDLLEYLNFNTERLTGEVKEFPDVALSEKKKLANMYADAIGERNRIITLYETGKNPNGTRVSVRPTEDEVRRAKAKPKEIKKEFDRVDSRGKKLERSLKRCKENAAIVRDRLEAIR